MIIQANSYRIPLKDESIDCAITSPPYWSLRDYGTAPLVWDDPGNCEHDWKDASWKNPNASGGWQGGAQSEVGGSEGQKVADYHTRLIPGQSCSKCGAWCGNLGLEPTPEMFVSHLVKICREVRRVLKPFGTFWLNLGDSYSGSGNDSGKKVGDRSQSLRSKNVVGDANPIKRTDVPGLKAKNLIGIPWRVALALQADGWYLRSDVIWHKPNPMPESVSGTAWERHKVKIKKGEILRYGDIGESSKPRGQYENAKWENCPGCPKCEANDGYVLSWNSGRPTKAHEYIFMLTKSPNYFFDQEAVREPHKRLWDASNGGNMSPIGMHKAHDGFRERGGSYPLPNPAGRNIHTVWTIPTQAYREAHFACVDEETEMLTSRGWIKYNEIEFNDIGAQFNIETEKLSWGEIQGVAQYKVIDQKMITIGSKNIDMVLTPNHRCLIKRRHPKSRKYGNIDIISAESLKPSHGFPTSGKWIESLPHKSDPGEIWSELIGWYISEGHECKRSLAVEIYQSMTANPKYVETIRNLLLGVKAEFEESTASRLYRGEDTKQTIFRVIGYVANRLREICPNKIFPENSLSWSDKSCFSLLKGLIEGDGSIRDNGDRKCFVQKSKKISDIVHALSIRCGFSASLSGIDRGMHVVYLTKHSMRSFRGTNGKGVQTEEIKYTGVVWCPKLPLGTWVARRNGKVFITGNTYPEELTLRCIKAGTSEKGYCPKCGAPWVRIIERPKPPIDVFTNRNAPDDGFVHSGSADYGEMMGSGQKLQNWREEHPTETLGWKSTCSCNLDPVPGIVLDPFSGSGTTGSVSESFGRKYVGLELKTDYIEIAKRRITGGIKNKRILAELNPEEPKRKRIPKNKDIPEQENTVIKEISVNCDVSKKVETAPKVENKTRVVHCLKEKYDVYIGRWNPRVPINSEWANPYKIGIDGDRMECCRKYKKDFYSNSELQAKAIRELKGKVLGCWCKEEGKSEEETLCHGDIIIGYVDNFESEG